MDKTKLIEWSEPFDSSCKYNLICRMTIQDVIDYQMNRSDLKEKGFMYESDEQALTDFVVVHWASFVCE